MSEMGSALPSLALQPEIGPALPPSMKSQSEIGLVLQPSMTSQSEIGPVLPPSMTSQSVIGPALPPSVTTHKSEIGPALPPSLTSQSEIGPVLPPSMTSQSEIGPVLPPSLTLNSEIGPELPPTIKNPSKLGPALPQMIEYQSEIGPTLPPSVKIQPQIGPAFPPSLSQTLPVSDKINTSADVGFGPVLPPGYHEEPEGPLVGPLPYCGTGRNVAAFDIEKRAERMKEKLAKKNDPTPIQRESWMTEVPTDRINNALGLVARKLGSGTTKIDSSSWTETPNQKEQNESDGTRRKKQKIHREALPTSHRDKVMAKQVDDYNKSKRTQSLLNMHTEKVTKKKAKQDKNSKPVRKAFDREEDMKISGLDSAAKKKLISQSQNYSSKFGHGSSQFL